jgi:tetratricopeptide (TPR) repeat protein
VGRREEAIKDFQISVAAVDNYLDGWLNLARGLQQAGRKREALDAWNHVLALQKDQPEAMKAQRQMGQQP